MLQNKFSQADEAIKKHQDVEPVKKPKILTKKELEKNEMIAINCMTARKKFETANKHWRLAYEAYESDKIEMDIELDPYGYDDEPAPNLSKKGNAAWKKSRKLLVIKNKLWMESHIAEEKFNVLQDKYI
jgi:hypothetical protein